MGKRSSFERRARDCYDTPPDSKHTGKDNCCWYRFDPCHVSGPKFIGRDPVFTTPLQIAEAA